MTGSLVFEEVPFAFPRQSTGTPGLPACEHVNNKRRIGMLALHRADYVSYKIEKYIV
jgi:hypothetical protein